MKKSFMKSILFSTMAMVVLFCVAPYAEAGPTINPGETYEFTGAEGAQEEVSSCTGNNHCVTDWMDNDIFVATILVEGDAQEAMANISAYNTFAISEGDERRVGAVLNGILSWEGFLNVGAEDGARAAIDIKVEIFDLTGDKTIASQTVHNESCSSTAEEPCYSHEKGNGGVNLYASLIRGHEYEIRVIGQCYSEFETATEAVCAFIGWNDSFSVEFGDGFISWSGLELTVEADPFEDLEQIKDDLDQVKEDLENLTIEIEQLRTDLDNLIVEVQQLKEEFMTHTHVYKTGKGVGHNNTDAETAPPSIDDTSEEGSEEESQEIDDSQTHPRNKNRKHWRK